MINDLTMKVKFNHQKPTNISGSKLDSIKVSLSNKLSTEKYDLNKFMEEKVYENIDNFRKLKVEAYVNLDINKIIDSENSEIMQKILNY